ncbi:MAG TPA: hypothetical protein VOB72_02150 [Candidatus Dormibacteraeota bacterium]|nr:hypothetical protein [Candidatus Dormibacteraeota bacterium]
MGGLLLTAALTPSAQASGGPGGGNGAGCNPTVGGHVGATSPVPVSESATVNCPLVSGAPGVPYGPPSNLSGPKLTPGQGCSYVVYRPIKVEVTSDGNVIEHDPSNDGSQYGSLTYPGDLKLIPVTTAQSNNIYLPTRFNGKADASGNCTIPDPGWALGCPDPVMFTNFVVAGNVCWFTTPNAVNAPPLPAPTLLRFLDQAQLLQFIHIGSFSSLPDNPNAGLVNIGTCYFVNGAAFQAAGALQPIQQPVTLEMSVSQPVNDGTGRFIFYVFRITIAYTGATWDFDDGSTTPDATLPDACQAVQADIKVSHTYRKYGTFNVTITENFAVTVNEFWSDSAGQHGPVPVAGAFPPIARILGPYQKVVIQEEGVPVGG